MRKFHIRKRDNSTHGHGEWAVLELMGNQHFTQWVEVHQGDWDGCDAWIKRASR